MTHYVRIVFEGPGGAAEYHRALDYARVISEDYPYLTVEVTEDKVWARFPVREENTWDARTSELRMRGDVTS